MSANRKLLAEILSTLKKVEEGVQLFDEVWAKVYAAGQQALKEKFEGDLKKEIKKLQRLRDQIKTWIGSPEIKDKNQLIEARKTIEAKMEQFKICEKDTKTKAYSKEGLARETRLDPKEAEKEEKITWLNSNMDRLTDLIDSLEADLEKLTKGKAKNKEQVDNLNKRIKKYKWHNLRLDQLIKLIDNDDLDPSKIDSIKDDVEYFIDNAAEDDSALGVDDEFDIYEELQLDSIVIGVKNLDDGEDDASGGEEGEEGALKKSAASSAIPIDKIGKPLAVKPAPMPSAAVAAAIKAVPVVAKPASAPVAEKKATPAVQKSPNSLPGSPAPAPMTQPLPQPRYAAALGDDKEAPVSTSWASAATQRPTMAQSIKASPSSVASPMVASSVAPPVQEAASIAPAPSTIPVRVSGPPPRMDAPVEYSTQPSPQQQQPPQLSDAKIGSINPEIMIAINMLKQSMLYCRVSSEPERPIYVPRNAYPTNSAYPTQPPPIVESSILFEKLPIDTLFFAFYHQQGLHSQVLAAKQLKKQSWRFHKKYMTWFQRHEEPKRTEVSFEEGTYVYFDYESGWCQRIKSEFKFEYAYLEDEQQNPPPPGCP